MLRVGCLLLAAADLVTFVAGTLSLCCLPRRWHVFVRGAINKVHPSSPFSASFFILDPAAVDKFLKRSSDEELYQLPFDPENSNVLSGMKVRLSRQIERVTVDLPYGAELGRRLTLDVAPGSEAVWGEDGQLHAGRSNNSMQEYERIFNSNSLRCLQGVTVLTDLAQNWEGRFGARDNLKATAARVEVAELLLTFGAAPNGTKIFKTIPDHLTDPVGHEEAERELNQHFSPLYCAWRLDTDDEHAWRPMNRMSHPLFHDYGDDQRSLEAQARLPALLLLFGADFFDLFRGDRFWSNGILVTAPGINAPDKHPLRFVKDAKFGEGHGRRALKAWLKGVERSAVPRATSGNDRTMERLRFVIKFLEEEINQPATLPLNAFLAAGKLSQDTPQLSSPEAATGIRKGYAALAAYKHHETLTAGRFPLVVRAYKRRLARRLREKEERDQEARQNGGAAAVVQLPSLSTSIPDRSQEFEVLLQRIAEVQQEEAQDQQLVANAETLKRVAQLAQELNGFHVRLYNSWEA